MSIRATQIEVYHHLERNLVNIKQLKRRRRLELAATELFMKIEYSFLRLSTGIVSKSKYLFGLISLELVDNWSISLGWQCDSTLDSHLLYLFWKWTAQKPSPSQRHSWPGPEPDSPPLSPAGWVWRLPCSWTSAGRCAGARAEPRWSRRSSGCSPPAEIFSMKIIQIIIQKNSSSPVVFCKADDTALYWHSCRSSRIFWSFLHPEPPPWSQDVEPGACLQWITLYRKIKEDMYKLVSAFLHPYIKLIFP